MDIGRGNNRQKFAGYVSGPLNNGSISVEVTPLNTLVDTLINTGVWNNLDAFYVFAVPTQSAALINLKNPGTYDATVVGTPTFTANQGFTSNKASQSYITSNFNPSTAPSPKFIQNSASFSMWFLTNLATDESAGGYYDGTGGVTLAPRVQVQPNASMLRLNGNNLITTGATNLDCRGLWTVMRISSSTVNTRHNAVQISSSTSNTSTAPKNGALRFGGQSSTSISAHQFAMGAIGALTAQNDIDLYNAFTTYMAAIGS